MDQTYEKNHEHCQNCFKLYCTSNEKCKVIACDSGCCLRMHECKLSEHKLVCLKAKTPCTNSFYGCPAVLPRESIKSHLSICPASAIFCTMEWNRYPVYSKSRLSWVPFFQPNPVLVKGQLDVELALRDQRILNDVFKKKCRKGKAKKVSTTAQDNGIEKPPRHVESGTEMAPALLELEKKLSLKNSENSGETNNISRSQESRNESNSINEIELVLASCEHNIVDLAESEISRRLNQCVLSSEDKEQAGAALPLADTETKPYNGSNAPIDSSHASVNIPHNSVIDKRSDLDSSSSDNRTHCFDDNIKSAEYETTSLPPPPKFVPIHLAEPLGLNVMLETLPKFQKQTPLYSIPCNQVFRRDEYGEHFKAVHSDIHGGLNGWLEERCPLAQYGCTFVRYRLHPNTQCGGVVFNQDLGNFGIRTCMKDQQCPHNIPSTGNNNLLCLLPVEILQTIAGMLDGFGLCNLSRTCKLLREVCRSILEKKGIVMFEWEKRIHDNGEWSWQVRQRKWFFSTSFTPIKSWVHSNTPTMTAHLEKCSFYDRHVHHKQFRYHSTQIPTHVGTFDDTGWASSEYEDIMLPSQIIQNFERSEYFGGCMRDASRGAVNGNYREHQGKHNLEFVIQCNEHFAGLEHLEPQLPETPNLALSPAQEEEGKSSIAQGEESGMEELLSTDDHEFDPCHTADKIAQAYLYMYSGGEPGLASTEQSRPDEDYSLPLVHVPSSWEPTQPVQQGSLDIDDFTLASEQELISCPETPFNIQDPSLLPDPLQHEGLKEAKEAAEVVANAYMYLYTGSPIRNAITVHNESLPCDSAYNYQPPVNEALSQSGQDQDLPLLDSIDGRVENSAGKPQESVPNSDQDASIPTAKQTTSSNTPYIQDTGSIHVTGVCQDDSSSTSDEDSNMFASASDGEVSSDGQGESSTSMHITAGGEGPLFVSVEDIEHDEVGCSHVAYEIHVKV
ncbi:predicted protein [Nematostella vectensis]|uniref:TRAF-type domain-containing protein n=1 Tax=Nematostella vectensis TaxID=45351 RepID=A7S9N8_NEMVE|nr:predicted protein [Nematostella vectensis]|eukprot:XP_001631674.1 predicted protein [Nematostella vectensis]